MRRLSSQHVVLTLISSIAVLFGFRSCADHYYDDDFADGSSTQPTTNSSFHSSRGYYSGSHWFWGGSSYGSRSSGSSFSSHSSGTSRGGFGSSGHSSSS